MGNNPRAENGYVSGLVKEWLDSMKLCVLFTEEDSVVLKALKTIFKSSHTVKVVDLPICDLSAYLQELSRCNFKQAIIRCDGQEAFSGIYADAFLFDPALDRPVIPEVFKSAGRDSIFVLSSDYGDMARRLPRTAGAVVDFGLNSDAAVTASSISEDRFMCSVTRTIPSIYGYEMEMQEILVRFHPDYTVEQMLLIMACLMVLGFLF